MDALAFIASLINSLAWPGVVVVALLVVRKELPALVTSLRRLKYKELEIEFEASAKAIEKRSNETIPEAPKAITVSGSTQDELRNRLAAIADIAPRSAIVEAWLCVETAAVDVIRRRGLSELKSLPGPMRLRDELIRGELLNTEQVAVFEELRRLRNEAVHVPDAQFTTESVSNYISAALKLAAYLEQRAGEL